MAIPPLIGNPYNGYINPYYRVDDHPLLYGNNVSLDPSTPGVGLTILPWRGLLNAGRKFFWGGIQLKAPDFMRLTLPKTDSKFAPEKWMLGKRSGFLLGSPIFSGANLLLVSGRLSSTNLFIKSVYIPHLHEGTYFRTLVDVQRIAKHQWRSLTEAKSSGGSLLRPPRNKQQLHC